MTPEALHSSATCRWLTPPVVIEAARQTMGTIDFDPASEENGNKIVKATWYCSEKADGLSPKVDWSGNIWLNPPGDKRGELPKLFWQRLLSSWRSGKVPQAMFLLFSLNQIQTLQDVDAPTNYPILFFRKRLKFLNADTMLPATQPAQANALVYLPPRNKSSMSIVTEGLYSSVAINEFIRNFGHFGAITIPR